MYSIYLTLFDNYVLEHDHFVGFIGTPIFCTAILERSLIKSGHLLEGSWVSKFIGFYLGMSENVVISEHWYSNFSGKIYETLILKA